MDIPSSMAISIPASGGVSYGSKSLVKHGLDKKELFDIIRECGPFIKALGAMGHDMSRNTILSLYRKVSEEVPIAARAASPKTHLAEEITPFIAGFNILIAAYRNNKSEVQEAIGQANVNQYTDVIKASMFVAAASGALDVMGPLVEVSHGIDIKNSIGETCLHVASDHNQSHMVAYLIRHGASVHATSHEGHTPWTLIGGSSAHEDVSRILISAGAEIDFTRSTDQMNLLYQAAAGGHVGAVRTLLRRGVSPSYTTPFGWAPLHFAKTLEIMQLLVVAGADINEVSDEDKTPLDIHWGEDHKRTYLLNCGALRAAWIA